MNCYGTEKRIVWVAPLREGVLVTYEDGSAEVLPELVDDAGNVYFELWPNDPNSWLQLSLRHPMNLSR